MLPFIIAGLATGSVYGLIGVGLVLTYKTSGIFNFGHGALATVAAYLFYFLHVEHGVPLALSLLVAGPLLGIALGLVFERFAYGLRHASLPLQIVATVGVLLTIEAVASLIYDVNVIPLEPFLPDGRFHIGETSVGYDQVIVFAISLVSTALLYAFLRWARLGKAMRGVVDNPDLLSLAGTSPTVVRRWAWIISCFFVVLSGLLLAPSVGLSPTTLTLLIIQGFGAAALGAFTNIWLTWSGGLMIGVGAALITKYINSTSVLGGLAPSLPFVVLFLVILLFPRRRLVVQRLAQARASTPAWVMPGRLQIGLGVALLPLLCFVPSFAGYRLTGWTIALTYVILVLSLGLLVKHSGQVSLGQMTFAAVGAVVFSKLTMNVGVPWAPSLLLAGVATVPIGALLAIPAIRLSGLFLAIATFGFGLVVQNMFYQSDLMFGPSSLGLAVPSPSLSAVGIGPENALYYAVLLVGVLLTALVVVLTRTRLGRLLQAMSDSPLGLTAQGASVTTARVTVFCISAFIAAIAGALLAAAQTQVTGSSFEPTLSLLFLAVLIITPGSTPWYAVIAGAGMGLVPVYIEAENVTYWLQLLFGVFAMIIPIRGHARAPAGLLAALDRLGGRRRQIAEAVPEIDPHAAGRRERVADTALEVRGLSVRFGGLLAVDELTLSAPSGRITGLIGPNGAGKSTTFNACCGLVQAQTGDMTLGDMDLSGKSPAQRARAGLGRTFQQLELFDSLTVAQNVAMGHEAGLAGANVFTQIVSRPSEIAETRARADEAIALCGLESLAGVLVGSLSTGQRRLVELARCLAGDYSVLLLDEPSAGLDRAETERFGQILAEVVEARGVGILLVEHDVTLVMSVCSYLYVLDFGELIFEGTPGEVQASTIVQSAYLGSELDSGDTVVSRTATKELT